MSRMEEREGGRHGRKEWVLGQRGKEGGRKRWKREERKDGWSEWVGG